MHSLALLYLACILAGFALIKVPTSAVISAGIASFFHILGGIAIIVFSLALLYLGVKALIGK
ncbi:hypothetical protein RRV45_09975 [Bacillus sp. DTU_2020_1000418_1_SI_GHA_SEK_038]|uniref:hypothetical protein n=1 Tax=Bacillus sp. DTU_2020_1000418_1_SI_GHA_SEK_038 TaxID=3077585 RepID=UPI0028E64615|nr:hypothetical protein [Bacillus sp. DTU_2020_1000418_1_SI_GHA_SEK_038]WNS77289.1 hypothetical protein RRV45_09975 [Bacillus sp. DTU_2020_1000418_1_SI_GHA_SEK_038]